MIKKLPFLFVVLLTVTLIGCAKNPTVQSGSIEIRNENVYAKVAFNEDDRLKIRNYYAKHKRYKEVPPGLAKKDNLPPGLQQHIVKYGELPPGLEGRRLPLELERTLALLPEGYIRLKVGGDVVLMDEKTRVVVDIVWGMD
jgi:hypothetical protein